MAKDTTKGLHRPKGSKAVLILWIILLWPVAIWYYATRDWEASPRPGPFVRVVKAIVTWTCRILGPLGVVAGIAALFGSAAGGRANPDDPGVGGWVAYFLLFGGMVVYGFLPRKKLAPAATSAVGGEAAKNVVRGSKVGVPIPPPLLPVQSSEAIPPVIQRAAPPPTPVPPDFPTIINRVIDCIIDAVRNDAARSKPFFLKPLPRSFGEPEVLLEQTDAFLPSENGFTGEASDTAGEFLYQFQTEFHKNHDFIIPVNPVDADLQGLLQLPSGKQARVDVVWRNERYKNAIYAVMRARTAAEKSTSVLVMHFYDHHVNPISGALDPGHTNCFSLEKLVQQARPHEETQLAADPELYREMKGKQELLLRALYATVEQKVLELKPRASRSKTPSRQGAGGATTLKSDSRDPGISGESFERDGEGNEVGDDVWPSPDEPFPYGGGGWSRNFNADGTIHHFQRNCPHCASGSPKDCPYCGGTGAQRIGRGGRPLSKREVDQYWKDAE